MQRHFPSVRLVLQRATRVATLRFVDWSAWARPLAPQVLAGHCARLQPKEQLSAASSVLRQVAVSAWRLASELRPHEGPGQRQVLQPVQASRQGVPERLELQHAVLWREASVSARQQPALAQQVLAVR
jgi:hypothetical protein